MRSRANGEGSIFPYRNGYAAYAWVETPAGLRERKYVYGSDREEVHDKWIKLQQDAKAGPVATKTMTVSSFIRYWLREIVEPNLSPATYEIYEIATRLYIVPGIGNKKLSRLRNTDVQAWLNKVSKTCQCCAQGIDSARRPFKQKCCAIDSCCEELPSIDRLHQLRRILRAILTCAIDAGQATQNAAKRVKLPPKRKKRGKAWGVEEARKFLEHARAHDPRFYAAYVLTLVLGLRKGEVLGMTWGQLNFERAEVFVSSQLQRIGRQLLHRQVKTEASQNPLPLPAICVAALLQHRDRVSPEMEPDDNELLFRTKTGRPIEPRNFNRFFDKQIAEAGVPRITVHDARRTCATLLAALGVHPRVAMEILRHAQLNITMEIYTLVSDGSAREALQRLGESLEL